MWWVTGFVFGPVPITGLAILAFYLYYRARHLAFVVRVFEEKPLFIIPRGTPVDGAEDVCIPMPDGRTLRGCYLKTPAADRKGVILFGLEFGSNRWSCAQYCSRLLDAGYDVFACELRNQGDSDPDPTYDPLQWATDRDLDDLRAAVKYLHYRPDADPAGIGIFGISKGGSLGLAIAAEDRLVKCVCTDGAFATYTTVVRYMKKWVGIAIPSRSQWRQGVPDWFYGLLGQSAVGKVERRRAVEFVSVERAVRRLRQPLLMIHGGADTYITPEIAEKLFAEVKRAAGKELWVVPGAKHNQALHVAGDEYHAKVVAFFDRHLGRVVRTDSAMTETVPASKVAEALQPVAK
jgi:dipeptidyl aminopeptidase/acylaminoacyl peptidase